MSGARILVLAHGHPEIIAGGAEIAAHDLWRAYRRAPGVEAAWLLAQAGHDSAPNGRILFRSEGVHLWHQGVRDVFSMTAANLDATTGAFAEFLRSLRPTAVHVHHYVNFGLEILKVIKDVDPGIRTLLTLHEYIAICPNAGQMRPLSGTGLCASGHWAAHLGCAPEDRRSPEALWLRHHRFRAYFRHVDRFVAPSDFLRARYLEWGLAPDEIVTIPNGRHAAPPLPPRPLVPGEGRGRFGYFGQIAPHKGLDLVLEGLTLLPPEARRGLVLEIHGANIEHQPLDWRVRVSDLARPLLAEGTLVWGGPYGRDELAARMAGIDWVIVPSQWYENAPLVIGEAFAHGRPVLATGIGGMAEAVRDGTDGLHLPLGRCDAWAGRMAALARETGTFDSLVANLAPPPDHDDVAARHLALLDRLGAAA